MTSIAMAEVLKRFPSTKWCKPSSKGYDEARRQVCWLLRSWAKTEKDVALERGWDCFDDSPLDRLQRLDEECGLE